MGSLLMLVNLVRTKLTFGHARLIRFPIDLRGKSHITVGKGFTTGRNCRIEALPQGSTAIKLLQIGNHVQLNDNVHITACQSVIIGNHVLMASKVYISDVSHGGYDATNSSVPGMPPTERPLLTKPVIIEDNVWLGDGVCVLPGVTIGYGSIIGANAVVNRSIPPKSIAVGIPAKVVKHYNEERKSWERVS